MKRDDFLNELEQKLGDIPEGDRLDAIEYYYDYFDEAGEENEQKVIRELGSPERVAQTIRDNLGASGYTSSRDYSESRDYSDPRDYSESRDYSEPRDYSAPEDSGNTRNYDDSYENSSSKWQERTSRKTTSWVVIAIIAILTFPLWIGIVAGLFGGLIGLIGGLFGLVIGLLGAAFGLIVGGIACCIAILLQAAFVGPAELLVTIGVGALLVALGLLFALLFVWLVARWIPSWVKAIVSGVKGLLNRK